MHSASEHKGILHSLLEVRPYLRSSPISSIIIVREPVMSEKSASYGIQGLIVSSNFASADFRKMKTYNFQKSESY